MKDVPALLTQRRESVRQMSSRVGDRTNVWFLIEVVQTGQAAPHPTQPFDLASAKGSIRPRSARPASEADAPAAWAMRPYIR